MQEKAWSRPLPEPTQPRSNVIQILTSRNTAEFKSIKDVSNQAAIGRLTRGFVNECCELG
jgi:hypothetical protein